MINSQTLSLHRISELPFDADAEIFRHYPGFKLGVTSCVSYYARLMFPLVQEVIRNEPSQSSWILTAPPITAETPSAANLLGHALFELYLQACHSPESRELSLIDLRHDRESSWADWKDPAKSQDYAKLDFADRVNEHERLSRQLLLNDAFQGHPVLFVNDIRVTGAQEHAMQRYFEAAGAACVRWLYVIVVDAEIGRKEPAIEWQLNFVPFDELLRMVSREQIEFTGKCAQRLMSLSLTELEQVVRALNSKRRTSLLELVERNRFESMDGYREQVKLLRSLGE